MDAWWYECHGRFPAAADDTDRRRETSTADAVVHFGNTADDVSRLIIPFDNQTYGVELGLVDPVQVNVSGCGVMSSVLGMILHWGSTIRVSIELPVSTRHHRDMTEKLWKAMLNPNKQQQCPNVNCLKKIMYNTLTVANLWCWLIRHCILFSSAFGQN